MRQDGEVFCELRALAKVLERSRTLDVVCEIAEHVGVNGVASIDWSDYRKRTGVHSPNLNVILKALETAGLICRDVADSGKRLSWCHIWVNPIVLRHGSGHGRFLSSDIQRFYKRRVKLEIIEDKAEVLLEMKPKEAPLTRKYTLRSKHHEPKRKEQP